MDAKCGLCAGIEKFAKVSVSMEGGERVAAAGYESPTPLSTSERLLRNFDKVQKTALITQKGANFLSNVHKRLIFDQKFRFLRLFKVGFVRSKKFQNNF